MRSLGKGGGGGKELCASARPLTFQQVRIRQNKARKRGCKIEEELEKDKGDQVQRHCVEREGRGGAGSLSTTKLR